MAKRLAPQSRPLFSSEVRIVSVDFSGLLDQGETLSAVLAVAEAVTASLEVTGQQINTEALVINGATVPAGHAVLFRVDHNGAPAGTYRLDIECTTSAGQEVTGSVLLKVYG